MLPHVPGYQVVKLLGNGSDGKVYQAVDSCSKAEVAIKAVVKHHNRHHFSGRHNDQFLPNNGCTEKFKSGKVQRAIREAKILKKLDHPFVIKVLDTVETQEHLFLVMQYAENGDLFDLLYDEEGDGQVDEQLAKRIFSQTLLALEYSHRHRIVHRDLKPG